MPLRSDRSDSIVLLNIVMGGWSVQEGYCVPPQQQFGCGTTGLPPCPTALVEEYGTVAVLSQRENNKGWQLTASLGEVAGDGCLYRCLSLCVGGVAQTLSARGLLSSLLHLASDKEHIYTQLTYADACTVVRKARLVDVFEASALFGFCQVRNTHSWACRPESRG